ncbi:MAG: hypothetical protein ABSB33_08230 [Tepidisphaeraceae bacterium]|jgi:hypothetical protein
MSTIVLLALSNVFMTFAITFLKERVARNYLAAFAFPGVATFFAFAFKAPGPAARMSGQSPERIFTMLTTPNKSETEAAPRLPPVAAKCFYTATAGAGIVGYEQNRVQPVVLL